MRRHRANIAPPPLQLTRRSMYFSPYLPPRTIPGARARCHGHFDSQTGRLGVDDQRLAERSPSAGAYDYGRWLETEVKLLDDGKSSGRTWFRGGKAQKSLLLELGRSVGRGRAYLLIAMESSNQAVVTKATRAPLRSSSAFVPTVVPCFYKERAVCGNSPIPVNYGATRILWR